MSYAPYQPPPIIVEPYRQDRGPTVLVWYIAYCLCMALLYLACLGGAGVFIAFAEQISDEDMPPAGVRIMGAIFGIICAPLLLMFAAGPFLPRNKFGWIMGCVNICIGLTSGCTLIPCIFLLIGWLHVETKAYYGMR